MICKDYMERLYAGWLGKIIGIRLGAPVESWTYEKIRNIYGEPDGYVQDFRTFAADDDSNGPLFFLRALENSGHGADMTAQDVGDALLNYAPCEHGFFAWGASTENLAYQNLLRGVPAPRSGSIEQNGVAMAEQIGGQIFIDTWGLVAPGNPALAAKLAEKAASVTHGGNGVYGGIFVAVCESLAFVEHDIRRVLDRALEFIPHDCAYARAVRDVMAFHDAHPDGDWHEGFRFVQENYGYDRYPGWCHIIPNTCAMIVSMLYGGGDFNRTVVIANLCGWDTDCNAGNVGAIMGVLCGLEGIDWQKWAKPINDILICSSVMGSLNIMDIPYGASYIAEQAYALAGEEIPEPYRSALARSIDGCHFEYPHSTHGMRVRGDAPEKIQTLNASIANTAEAARTGLRSLKITATPVLSAERVYVYKKTYYRPADFEDSRYDPCFSPLLYPGQTITGSAMTPEYSECDCYVRLYVKDLRTGEVYMGERQRCERSCWADLSYQIPALDGAMLGEAGFLFESIRSEGRHAVLTAFVDDLVFSGTPDYRLDFSKENIEFWNISHQDVSQMTRLKGHLFLQDEMLRLSCSDYGEAYTGRHDFTDYEAVYEFMAATGEKHFALARVQGACRSYAFGFDGAGRVSLLKNEKGYRTLASAAFDWKPGTVYTLSLSVCGGTITGRCGDVTLSFTDENPYLQGGVGVAVRDGSHIAVKSIAVHPTK